jgi:hypothetical protein
MNFTGASNLITGSGPVDEKFSYDMVQCTGTEKTLDECPHSNGSNCYIYAGIWLVCVDPTGKFNNNF